MREFKKKADEEMLIVHKAAMRPDPDRLGRSRTDSSRAPALEQQELELLKARVSLAKDSLEKRNLIAQIQRKFGNEMALEVVREMREQSGGDDLKPKLSEGQPTKGKT